MSIQFTTGCNEGVKWEDADLHMIINKNTGSPIRLKNGSVVGFLQDIKDTLKPEWQANVIILNLSCIVPLGEI